MKKSQPLKCKFRNRPIVSPELPISPFLVQVWGQILLRNHDVEKVSWIIKNLDTKEQMESIGMEQQVLAKEMESLNNLYNTLNLHHETLRNY